MNFSVIVVSVIVSICGQRCSHGARILGMFHMPSKSHHILGSALLKTLAKKGHDVTMVSPYPFKEKVENYRDIFLEEFSQYKEVIMKQSNFTRTISYQETIIWSSNFFYDTCKIVLTHPEIKKLKAEKFDLVIQFATSSESLLGLAHHWGAPVIYLSTKGSSTLTTGIVGNPSPISYVSNGYLPFPKELSFSDRVKNTLNYALMAIYGFNLRRSQEDLYQKYFPSGPPLQELMNNVSLVLCNSHWSIESPRPYLPNVIQIGGFHVQEPKELPPDLKNFLDDATEGAVYFSLGSNVKLSLLRGRTVNGILRALSRLKMKVILKTDQNFVGLPDHIKVGNWFPQNDILGHPNIKVFVTHGGLLSTTEAVYHGVPIVGIPVFGDQGCTVTEAVFAGFAVKVELQDLTEESLYNAIQEVSLNHKYRGVVQLKSSLLREQPIKPMDLAVFWVEHVLKHKGAPHLRNAGVKLNWYQYYLLDVFLFLVIGTIMVLLVMYLFLGVFYSTCRKLLKNNGISRINKLARKNL